MRWLDHDIFSFHLFFVLASPAARAADWQLYWKLCKRCCDFWERGHFSERLQRTKNFTRPLMTLIPQTSGLGECILGIRPRSITKNVC